MYGQEESDFKVSKDTGFALQGQKGEIKRHEHQGADCDTYLFTPEDGGKKQMVKFVKDAVLEIGAYQGNNLEEKAKDIQAFYNRLRSSIGESIVPSKTIIANDPEGTKRVAIIQDFLEGESVTIDKNSPQELKDQETDLIQRYGKMRSSKDFPERWKRRTYDFGFDDNFFLSKGKLTIVDWL